MPKGNLLKQYLPYEVMTVVNRRDLALKGICQNPLFASSLLKSVAPANCARVSSTWGMGYVSRRTFSLRGFKLTQILTSPDRFDTTTMPAHYKVGSVTLLTTPIYLLHPLKLFSHFLT